MRYAFLVLTFLAILPCASAVGWTGDVETNTTSWNIERDSGTIIFDFTENVEGDVSPIQVTGAGRMSGTYGYVSYLSDIDVNDVGLRERTAALDGRYSSEEVITLCSDADHTVNMTIEKPAGTPKWTIEWEEDWPVLLNVSRTLDYTGVNINDREYVGNNLDCAGTTFLYNKELSKNLKSNLCLRNMTSKVVATDDGIISAEFKPVKTLDYQIETHSTGIANLKYRQSDSSRAVINEGDERYSGIYDISRKIHMESFYEIDEPENDWLSCCIGGCSDLDPCDHVVWGNENNVFNCVCEE